MMRNFFNRAMTASMLAGAALLVSACHHDSGANTSADTNMTDMNTMDSSAGLTNDASAMDAGANVATDNGAAGNADAPASGNAGNAM